MRFIWLSLLILLSLSYSSAPGQSVYGLKDCISIGLDRNFSILVAKNDETISKNNYTLGNAGFLPKVDLTGRYTGTLNNSTTNLTDGTQTISNGIFNSTTSGSVALGMTIFNGFNVVTTYKKLGELNLIGQLNTQLAVENLIADIVSGYYNYILQVQLMNNLKYALILSRERLRIDEDRYLLGSGSKLEVLQSRVYVNSDSSNLSRQNEVVRSAQIRLNEMMAVENLDNEFTSRDTSIDVNPGLLYEKLLEETIVSNTNLLIASKNKTISDYDYKLRVSRSYPYLNFSGGYGYNLNTFTSSPNKNQITNGMNYGLTLGVKLFDGNNQRRSIHNSSIERDNKELRYREVEQGIKADLLTIYSAYSNNLRLISLEEQNFQTAKENLDIALERYKLGSLSGIDLREVQKSLLDARERLISAHYQTKLAEVSLQLISGKIMEYYK
ncbi:MAG: TolC family protein [Bacteroidetes bacterium]|nr:MAG: TolC family protein [Bacteroidota bacterium]